MSDNDVRAFEDGTFVRVSNREIYAKLVSMEMTMAALNGRLDIMTAEHRELRQHGEENRKRIIKLETWRNGIIVGLTSGGIIAAITLLKGLIG